MKDYVTKEPQNKSNKMLIYFGAPLLFGTLLTGAATLPITAPIISQTWDNFYTGLMGGRRIECNFTQVRPSKGDGIDRFVEVHRGTTPEEIRTLRLRGIFIDANPQLRKEILERGVYAHKRYKVPMDCKFQ